MGNLVPLRSLGGQSKPSGAASFQVRPPFQADSHSLDHLNLREVLRQGGPQRGLPQEVNRFRASNLANLWRGYRQIWPARLLGIPFAVGSLHVERLRPQAPEPDLKDLLKLWGEREHRHWLNFPVWLRSLGIEQQRTEFGLASLRVVTTAGVNFIVDAFQNSVEVEVLKYHGIGTGTNAENASDTALQTESTTALNPDSTRATGSLTEGASANIFRTVGTVTVDASVACTEHGIFSQAATGGGTLLDRSVFSVINLAAADSVQSTYDLTLSSGG